MIVDILIIIVGSVLFLIRGLFAVFTYVIPTAATDSITWAFSQLAYVQALFPVDTLLEVLTAFLAFILLYFSFRLVLFIYAITPFIGKKG
jgi:hypothetical protein